jgi:hypothetical protein
MKGWFWILWLRKGIIVNTIKNRRRDDFEYCGIERKWIVVNTIKNRQRDDCEYFVV